MLEEFESFSFDDFKQTFLLEASLDKTSAVRLGELSRSLSDTNLEVARKLNSWVSNISVKVQRYIKRLGKRSDAKIGIRVIPVDDGKTETAAIMIVTIDGRIDGEVEVAVFDNNRIAVRMSDSIARHVNRGRNRKFMTSKDKIADYVIGILEKLA